METRCGFGESVFAANLAGTFAGTSERGQRGHVRPLFWGSFGGQTPSGAFSRIAGRLWPRGRALVEKYLLHLPCPKFAGTSGRVWPRSRALVITSLPSHAQAETRLVTLQRSLSRTIRVRFHQWHGRRCSLACMRLSSPGRPAA
jgi:hypothetical protein